MLINKLMSNRDKQPEMTRRQFLGFMGKVLMATAMGGALAGLEACGGSGGSSKIEGPTNPTTATVAESLTKLIDFLNSTNASKQFTNPITALKERAVYHNPNRDTHIKCRKGTTTETMALKFILDVLQGKISGDHTAQEETYNYFTGELWPNNGTESNQLPDSKLTFPGAPTRLAPWLIQIDSSLFPRDNTLYEIYNDAAYGTDPISCITLDASGLPCFDPDIKWGGLDANNHFRFGAALDADQWVAAGFVLAGVLGTGNYATDITESKDSLFPFLTNTGTYKNIMKFAAMWGGRVIDDKAANTWKTTTEDLYTAYQMPVFWHAANEPLVANNIVQFLIDAQTAFKNLTGDEGLFMPVYKNNAFTFSGADPNTHWMGFQYRTFRALAFYYAATKSSAVKNVLDKFIAWVEANKDDELPYWIYSGVTDGEGIVHNGGSVGEVESWMFSPHEYALYSQGLALLYATTEDAAYKQKRDWVNAKIIEKQATSGAFLDPESNTWYGFHQTEVGIAFALAELNDNFKNFKTLIDNYRSNFTQEITSSNPVYKDPVYFPNHSTNWTDYYARLAAEFDGTTIAVHGLTEAVPAGWWVGSMGATVTTDLSAYRYLNFDVLAGKAQLYISLDGYVYQFQVDATSGPQTISIDMLTQISGLTVADLADGVEIRLGLVAYDSSQTNGVNIGLTMTIPKFQ